MEKYLDENCLSLADFQLYKAVVPSDITRNDFDMIFIHPNIYSVNYDNLLNQIRFLQPKTPFHKGKIIALNL